MDLGNRRGFRECSNKAFGAASEEVWELRGSWDRQMSCS